MSVFGDERISTRADPTPTRRAVVFWRQRVIVVNVVQVVVRWPIRPIWGLWGSKVPQNGKFPALDVDEPPCKIWLGYVALFSAEKSVTVQTKNTQAQTQPNSKRYIHTLPIGMCG